MSQFSEQQGIIDEYNKKLRKSQNIAIYTRDIEIQRNEIRKLEEFDVYLDKQKKYYVERRNEKAANLILCLQLGTQAVANELSMIVALKNDNPGDAWNNLIEAQNLTDSVIQNHPINGDSLLGFKSRLLGYEVLLFPKMIFSSIGGIVKSSECSICGKPYDACDHIKGRFYMGEMCVRIIKEIDLEEVSMVESPADKRCRPISIPDEYGDQRDVFTLRKNNEIQLTNH